MQQVWFCETGDNVALTDERHIVPSLQISFSTCTNVKIDPILQDANNEGVLHYRVTGRRRDDTADFDETHIFTRIQVYDQPTHL